MKIANSSWGVARQITFTQGMREVGLTEEVKVGKGQSGTRIDKRRAKR